MACRKCSECHGAEHHWIAVCRRDGDDPAEAMPRWECKHCPATMPYDPDTEDGFPRKTNAGSTGREDNDR